MRTLRYNTETKEYTTHNGQYTTYDGRHGRIDPPWVQLEVVEVQMPVIDVKRERLDLSYDIEVNKGKHDLFGINGTATEVYEVIQLTTEEIIANTVPQTITPAQGRVQLLRMGLLDTVEQLIMQQPEEALIFWQYAQNWEFRSPTLNGAAITLNVDLPQFFIDASKIEI